jgi:hypothetical protein
MFIGFYMWLQPIVFIEGMIGILIMYYLHQYLLMNICNKPRALSNLLFFQMIYCAEDILLSYSVGNILIFLTLVPSELLDNYE